MKFYYPFTLKATGILPFQNHRTINYRDVERLHKCIGLSWFLLSRAARHRLACMCKRPTQYLLFTMMAHSLARYCKNRGKPAVVCTFNFHRSAHGNSCSFISARSPNFTIRNKTAHNLATSGRWLVIIDGDGGSTRLAFGFSRGLVGFILQKPPSTVKAKRRSVE